MVKPFNQHAGSVGSGATQVMPPGDAVTVQDVTAGVPSRGTKKSHVTRISVNVPQHLKAAVTWVGAIGKFPKDGVIEFDALDAELLPTLFVAVTVKVYPVPFVRPVTLHGLLTVVQVNPPGDEVTV